MDYAAVDLAKGQIIGHPGRLPSTVEGLSDLDLSDLSFLPVAHGFSGIGFYPLVLDDPLFDPATQTLDVPIIYSVDAASRIVRSARTVRALTDEQLGPRRAASKSAVMARRDVEIDAGMTFNGKRFQTRADDRENISGASILAFMATARGAQAGDLYWNGGADPFAWIAEDNSIVTMDAPTVMAFGAAAAARKQACIFHAYGLKAAIDAAADPSSIDIDAGWPA